MGFLLSGYIQIITFSFINSATETSDVHTETENFRNAAGPVSVWTSRTETFGNNDVETTSCHSGLFSRNRSLIGQAPIKHPAVPSAASLTLNEQSPKTLHVCETSNYCCFHVDVIL